MIILTYLLLKFAFKNRSDNNPNLKYFTVDDFPNISAQPISFKTKHKLTLQGFIYRLRNKQTKGRNHLLIFNHGIGAGHHAYMHFIAELVEAGFTVMAYDNTGCQLSEGKNIIGLTQAIIDLKHALAFVDEQSDLKDMPLSVIGHSWGGFTASHAFRLSTKVKSIVAISSFIDVNYILFFAKRILKFLKPFIIVANYIKFGKYSCYSVTKSIKKSERPMLLISGRKDPVIAYEKNYLKYKNAASNKSNISFILENEKHHNPYLTLRGERYFNEVFTKLKEFKNAPSSPEKRQFFNDIDYELITENDPNIINQIIDFLTI
jgi:uncharacterized protein